MHILMLSKYTLGHLKTNTSLVSMLCRLYGALVFTVDEVAWNPIL
jgi:hypothetical protein